MTKSLNLDRELIDNTIENYFKEDFEIKKKLLKGCVHYIITTESIKGPIILAFYFNDDGTTTITFKIGKNQSEGEKIAIFLKNNCVSDSRKSASLTLSENSPKKDIEDFFEYINIDLKNEIKIEEKPSKLGIIYKIKHLKKGDHITLIYYNSGKLFIQGKPLFLFNYITNYFIEFGTLTIKEYGNVMHKVDLKVDVLEELKNEIPKAYPYLGTNLKKIISSTLFIKNIDVDLPEYSFVVFPILRGLEGVLRELIIRYNISTVTALKTFNMFEDKLKNGIYNLKAEHQSLIDANKLKALEDLYNFFFIHRHGVFHVQSLDVGTRLISTRAEALILINEAIANIENNY